MSRATTSDSSLLFAFISILPLGYIETSTPLYVSNNICFVDILGLKRRLALFMSILRLVLTSNAVLPEHTLTEMTIFCVSDAKQIYKHVYKVNKNNMMGKNVSTLAISLFILVLPASAASDVILNGTGFYLTTGDYYGLPQGYILKLKSVSNEKSVWLELESNNTIIKSEIIHLKGNFTYNKTNRIILSIKVDNIYSGSKDSNLVSFFPVYQYIDPDMPEPKIIETTPVETPHLNNYSAPFAKQSMPEPAFWAASIIFISMLFYIVRKLW